MILAYMGFCVLITCALMSFFVIYNSRTKAHILWSFIYLSTALWGGGLFLAFSTTEHDLVLSLSRILNFVALFIPLFFVHFSFEYAKRKSWIVPTCYVAVFSLIIACYFNPALYIPDVSSKAWFEYYPDPGPLFYVFTIYFAVLSSIGFYILIKQMKSEFGMQQRKLKMIIWTLAFGFSGGGTTFPLVFNIPIYPFGVIVLAASAGIGAFIIIQQRLLDVSFILSVSLSKLTATFLMLGSYWILYKFSFQLPDKTFTLFLAAPITYFWGSEFNTISTKMSNHIDRLLAGSYYDLDSAIEEVRLLIVNCTTTAHVSQAVTIDIMFWINLLDARIYLVDNYLKPNTSPTKYELVKAERPAITSIPLDDPILEVLKKENRCLYSYEFEDYKRYSFFDYNCECMAPVFIKSEMVAILQLSSKKSGKFTTKDSIFIEKVMDHLGRFLHIMQVHEQFKLVAEKSFKTASLLSLMNQYQHDLKACWVVVMNKSRTTLKSGVDLGKLAGLLSGKTTAIPIKTRNWEEEFKDLTSLIEMQHNRAVELSSTMGRILDGKEHRLLTQLNLNNVIASTLKFFPPQAKIELVEEPALSEIIGDNQDLQILFINLFKNADEAMKSRSSDSERKLKITTSQDLDHVCVSVKDTAGGLPDSVLEAFNFDRQISTKSTGSGIGLLTIKRIISEHNGTLDIKVEKGVGTTFLMRFSIKK